MAKQRKKTKVDELVVVVNYHFHYQGLCHICQEGFFYPGGDCKTSPQDERHLQCAVCGFGPHTPAKNSAVKKVKENREAYRQQRRKELVALAESLGHENADSLNNYQLEEIERKST